MIKFKIAILTFITLLAFACGSSDTPSSNQAESKPLEQKSTVATTTNDTKDSKKQDLSSAEKEMIAESSDSDLSEPESAEVNSENIENPTTVKTPKPLKVNQKIEAKKVLNEVEEKVENISPPSVGEPIKEVPEIIKEEKKIEETIEKKKPVVKEEVKETVPSVPAFSHDSFDQLLKKYVSAKGKVNYSGFKADQSKLDAYLKALDDNPPASGWSKSKKMAYWINAYNAGTIKLILKNYPVSSITKLHGGKPWDQKWIPLGGKTYSLNNIENDILRPVYKDARIHFAVNCAAKSCPPLLNRAWTEGNLNRYLAQQTKAFVNDTAQNKISANAVEISKIFEWYAVDFGNIIEFLNKYSSVKINPGAKVTYKEYNWDLNK